MVWSRGRAGRGGWEGQRGWYGAVWEDGMEQGEEEGEGDAGRGVVPEAEWRAVWSWRVCLLAAWGISAASCRGRRSTNTWGHAVQGASTGRLLSGCGKATAAGNNCVERYLGMETGEDFIM